MYIVDIEYIVPFEQVEPWLDEHMEFVAKHFEQGVFVVSGRKNPRTGGIIIVRNMPRENVEALMAEDPFTRESLVKLSITEFVPTNTAVGFEQLKQ